MNDSNSSQTEKVVIKGETLDANRCRAEDWGGETPVIIRAYSYSREQERSVFIGCATLAGGELREVSFAGSPMPHVFPEELGGGVRTSRPAEPHKYLSHLNARGMTSTYGPHYTFEIADSA